MSQLINKTELIKDLQKDISESDNWLVIAIYMAFTIRIMNYPVFELVHCKDCQNYETPACQEWNDDDDFCSRAERRKDD